MKSLLEFPSIYMLLQRAVGATYARKRVLEEYAVLRNGMHVLDIGCGTGYIINYLPTCAYMGFDINETYIAYARRRYGAGFRFHSTSFEQAQAEQVGFFDLILMNGLLHHLCDAKARTLLKHVHNCLAPGGMLLTLDGCYMPGQNVLASWLLDHDRGEYVRDVQGYQGLVANIFSNTALFIRSDLSRLPYTFIVMRCTNE